jgi:hypothetical protein
VRRPDHDHTATDHTATATDHDDHHNGGAVL